jgi:MFS family permease
MIEQNNYSKNHTTTISIFNGIVRMLTMSLSFFLAVHFVKIGLTGIQIGLIFATSTLTSIITIIPSGFSNDKFKSKNLITLALIFLSIQYIGISVTKEFPIIVILFLIGGMGSTLYTASSESLFYKSTQNKDTNKKIGLFQSLNYLLGGIGIISAGFILQNKIPFEKLFLIFGIGFLIMSIISQLILQKSETSEFEFIKYKKDIFRAKVLLFLLIMFLFSIHYGAENTTYGLFLEKTLKLNSAQMGLYMGIAIISMSLATIFISKKLHKWNAKYLILFGLFASGIAHILMTITQPQISIIFRIFHEIGDAAMFFFLYYGITKLFDLKRIGGNAGIFTFTTTVGGALGAVIFGPLGEKYGYNIPLITSGIVILIALVLAILFLRHFDHETTTT